MVKEINAKGAANTRGGLSCAGEKGVERQGENKREREKRKRTNETANVGRWKAGGGGEDR